MYILAIDQGTTGTTTVLYNQKGEIVDKAYKEFTQIFPQPGWVEHDPKEIWQTVIDTIEELIEKHKEKISAIGITNQRETTILWNKNTGEPIYNAIVWQCRRTADYCDQLQDQQKIFKEKTGLPLDAYFSGTKIKWILENTKEYNIDDIIFGTIDTWLIWKLTNGETHATDYTNASRTLIYNIKTKQWDKELCEILNIPLSILPEVKKSIDDYGQVESITSIKGTPIYGVAGDQQAALFGQLCFNKGEVKNTYGTGCFLLMNTGKEMIESKNGLITTLGVNGSGDPCYVLEGSIFIAGAAIQWLRDQLKILKKASDSEEAALSIKDNEGVYLVPAFVGLGAPHWNMQARGTLVGLTRGTNQNHIIRAALEAMAYQTNDVIKIMEQEAETEIKQLTVDGGATANNFLMQFQADIINKPVLRPTIIESTSLGAGFMAGLKAGLWNKAEDLHSLKSIEKQFNPKINLDQREILIKGWNRALQQTKTE